MFLTNLSDKTNMMRTISDHLRNWVGQVQNDGYVNISEMRSSYKQIFKFGDQH